MSLSIKGGSDVELMGQSGNNKSLEEEEEEDHETASLSLCNKEEDEVKVNVRGSSSGAFNVTKHLWSGAVAAMVSRFLLSLSLSLFSVFCLISFSSY